MDVYDLIVIGGGPAGYSAALQAVKSCTHVALLENNFLGGTCLNKGCIPTKILLEAADVMGKFRKSSDYAVNITGNVSINRKVLIERKNRVIESLRDNLESMLSSSGVEIIHATGKLLGNGEVFVNIDKPYTISGRKIIISSGSRESCLDIEGSELMIGSAEALDLNSIPKDVCIIGGGVIGVEFATFYSGVGSGVHIIEALPDILVNVDSEIARMMRKSLEEKGVKISTGCKVKALKKSEKGLIVIYEQEGQKKEVLTQTVLNAAGRRPNTGDLDLERCGIKCDMKGYIAVDKFLKTTAENIYAAGDVTGGLLLAHVAFDEGITAAINALSGDVKTCGAKVVPQCIYTHPEMGSVGLTEDQAREQNIKIRKGCFPLSSNGRALVAGHGEGIVKIITDDNLGQILGVHIWGEKATEVLAAAVIAIEGEYTCEELTELIFAHPTVAEALKDATFGCIR